MKDKRKCRNCGASLSAIVTDLPFKVSTTSIVIIKQLPVLQCENCQEFMIEDPIMEQVEYILSKANDKAELEVVYFES